MDTGKLKSIRDGFVGTAGGVTLGILLISSGLLALFGGILFAYDLAASYFGWARGLADQVNLPMVQYLGYVVTGLPSLIQVAYIAARVADVPYARENKAFKWLFWGSLVMDTTLDIIQMNQGTPESFLVSTLVALGLFMFLSEFLIIFAGSVFIGLIIRIVDEPDLLKVDATSSSGASRPKGGQRRG